MSARLRTHRIRMRGERVTLRPLVEDDLALVVRWRTDPDLLAAAHDTGGPPGEEQVKDAYRALSQAALCFVVERDGAPVGECRLQQMDLERILARHFGAACRRIDVVIGDMRLWGSGYGLEVIDLLTDLAFEREGASRVYGCDIPDHNRRARRAFEKAGFEIENEVPEAGGAAKRRFDLVLTREHWASLRALKSSRASRRS